MHDIPQRIATVLLEVEAVLRTTGRWEQHQPSDSALSSTQPFCMDTLNFEQWLQWIFLPRMKQILENRRPLPARSAIHEYAECCVQKQDNGLLQLIKRFDELITIQAGQKFH